jgi:hypothetical protein
MERGHEKFVKKKIIIGEPERRYTWDFQAQMEWIVRKRGLWIWAGLTWRAFVNMVMNLGVP